MTLGSLQGFQCSTVSIFLCPQALDFAPTLPPYTENPAAAHEHCGRLSEIHHAGRLKIIIIIKHGVHDSDCIAITNDSSRIRMLPSLNTLQTVSTDTRIQGFRRRNIPGSFDNEKQALQETANSG